MKPNGQQNPNDPKTLQKMMQQAAQAQALARQKDQAEIMVGQKIANVFSVTLQNFAFSPEHAISIVTQTLAGLAVSHVNHDQDDTLAPDSKEAVRAQLLKWIGSAFDIQVKATNEIVQRMKEQGQAAGAPELEVVGDAGEEPQAEAPAEEPAPTQPAALEPA